MSVAQFVRIRTASSHRPNSHEFGLLVRRATNGSLGRLSGFGSGDSSPWSKHEDSTIRSSPLVGSAGSGRAVAAGRHISGQVTFKGEPLGSGQVTFYGPHTTVPASIGNDGTYTARKVPLGSFKVTVETFPPPGGGKSGPSALQQGTVVVDGQPVPPPGKYVEIPTKYKDPAKSDLAVEVTGGKQQFDIPLR
jgi:hypothetical protein